MPAPPNDGAPTIRLINAASTVPIPVTGGITGAMTFPAVSVGTTVQLSASTLAPPGVALAAQRRPTALGTLAIYEYVTLTPQTTVTLPSLPAFTLTFPASIATLGKSFFFAVSAPHGVENPSHFDAHGPAAVSGQTVNFTAVPGPLTLTAGNSYTFIVYATFGAGPGPSTPRIFVANQDADNTLAIFNPDGSPGTPAQIEASTAITAVAVDSAGKIYLTHQDDASLSDTLTTYNANGTPATPTIRGLHSPKGVAVDAAGKIYVVSSCCGADEQFSTLTTFDQSGAQTAPSITTGLDEAVAVAVDRNGKIYVLNACCEFGFPAPIRIQTYLPDGTPATPTIDLPQDEQAPVGIAVDAAGKIYVANDPLGSLGTMLATYAPTGARTIPTIVGRNFVSALAVDAAGKIYLSSLDSVVTTYKPDGTPTVPRITVGVFSPSGIAVH